MAMMGQATAGWRQGLAEAAWAGFIQWAHTFPEIRARFTAETGMSLDARRTPIEEMVDAATGYRASVRERFVEWATREIWGLEYAPAKYRDEMKRKATPAAVTRKRTKRSKPKRGRR